MQVLDDNSLSGSDDPVAARLPARWAATRGDANLDPLWSLLTQHGRAACDAAGVSVFEHGLRCAALAQQAGADEALVLAALFHDIGQLLERDFHPHGSGTAARQHMIAAAFLSLWFGPDVTEPVRLQIEARRFLAGSEPGYARYMSAARRGTPPPAPMSRPDCLRFLGLPRAREAILLCRWNDRAGRERVEPLPLALLQASALRAARR